LTVVGAVCEKSCLVAKPIAAKGLPCCAASSNRKETGGLTMFGTMETWGYGGYGQFHMVVWIILAIAVVAGVVWRLRSGSS